MKRIFCCAMFALLAFAAPAMAGIGAGNNELGFNYGQTNFDSNTGVDSGDHFALRGGHLYNEMFEVEGQFASASESQDVFGVDLDAKMRLYMVNGVFNFHPREEIVPYLMAGVGLANLEVAVPGIAVDDSGMAYQLGAGSRFFFGETKRTAFRVDISMVSENTFDESSTHTNVGAGFTWRLGQGN